MDSTYMESVWWALKTIWDKGLIYEGRKVLMYCPRCETPVSKAEIAMDNSYKDISEETVIVKFQITNFKLQINNKLQISNDKPVYILAWTTTPWTLPGNVALAVGKDIEYWILNVNDENLIVAKDRVESVIGDKRYEIGDKVKGVDLIGLEYEPLFDIPAIRETGQKAWYVTEADFVTTVDGTGVVHTAVVYGEEDYNLGLKIGLPVVPLLDSKGLFNEYAPDLIRGQYFKKAEKIIKEDLEKRGLMFSKENFTHSYPHCWRCDTQLFYNALSAWFINIQKVKSKLIKNNEKVNWYPEHLKHGRFLNILETAPDWNISRNRFWATPLPFWKCECGHIECVGSVKELKGKAINFDEVYKTDKVEELDLHKHLADKIRLKCKKCGSHMSRIPEVVDCWVESASMPFAEFHYPFENKETFKKRFPGQYIAEYIAQTRAWFYYMHVMAGLLFDDISFKNVVCTGTILNEKGEKLSKSKMNYTDPWVIIERYGTDALRYYLLASPVMQADDLYFNDNEVKEVYNKVINLLWNVVEFYKMYSENSANGLRPANSANVLDKWIMARLNELVKVVTEEMDKYNTVKAGRPIKDFIDDLSTWYVRRSRDRFKIGNEEDKQSAIATLREVLLTLSKIMAPFTPFMAEKMYLELGGELESVHLEKWPQINDKMINDKLIEQMIQARKVVEMGLALRAEAGIKVRQPLSKFSIFPDKVRDPAFHRDNFQFSKEMMQIIADELNVKKVEIGDKEIGDKEIGDKEIGD
ncbi:MAG: isoleucine--tRNA ligase, partial [Patescibacteria group bacterium]